MTDSLLLALDFGGTKHSIGLIASGATTWQAHRRVFSPPGADAAYDIRTVIETSRDVLDGKPPAAIGVSFGGPVDYDTGTVRLSHHVPGWENTALQTLLEDEFGVPARVDNDANVAALGEHRFGAGRGLDHLLYVTVSTGVGGGWILNGRPWRGAGGMAGEIGHTVVDPTGPLCLCGKRGCVERLASGSYIAEDVRDALTATPDLSPLLLQLAGDDLNNITGKLVSKAAARGDGFAWGRMRQAAWALGVSIGNAANLINPQQVILGGGVTKSGERFWQVVRETAHEIALPEVHFDVVPATFIDDAPLWGAVALAEDGLRGQARA